jgi:hypothetical protein
VGHAFERFLVEKEMAAGRQYPVYLVYDRGRVGKMVQRLVA